MFSCEFCEISKNIFLTKHWKLSKSGKNSKRSNTADYEAVHFFLYKNPIILDEPQRSYCFSKFQAHLLLFCSCGNYNFWPCVALMYFLEYFLLVMAGLKEKNYTLILKFVYITFCLTTNHCHFNHRLCCTGYVAAEDFDCIDLILL